VSARRRQGPRSTTHAGENDTAATDVDTPGEPDGIRFERDEHGGVTVVMDGSPQSYVQPDEPTLLVFEYVQHLALVVDTLSPEAPAPLAVTHVGGAGLTLPRWVEAVRPGSPQIVLEPDAGLTVRVRTEVPLPRRHRIRVRAQDGRAGVAALADASADVVVTDAYAGGRVPAELVGAAFATEVARVLRPGGAALWNLADEPGMRWVARVVATMSVSLPHVALLATHEVLKGRRFGNSVLVASAEPLPLDRLRRDVARAALPTGMRDGVALTRLLAGARPFAEVGEPSPPPPDAGGWRVR
jgi:spermidine synthase